MKLSTGSRVALFLICSSVCLHADTQQNKMVELGHASLKMGSSPPSFLVVYQLTNGVGYRYLRYNLTEHEPNRWLINALIPDSVKLSVCFGYSVNFYSQH